MGNRHRSPALLYCSAVVIRILSGGTQSLLLEGVCHWFSNLEFDCDEQDANF